MYSSVAKPIRRRANFDAMNGSARLTQPLVRDRKGGPLRPASWDEALDRAAEGFSAVKAAHGPKAFGLFSCSKGTNEMNYVAGKFARAVIGSNNIDSCNRT
jgi:formate dehydrogenase major subunit